MPQLTFQSVGASATQVDDTEVMSIVELSAGTQLVYQISWPVTVKIIDMRVPNNPVQQHQYGLWFKGAKKPGNLYATDLNPNQAGRMIFSQVESVFIRPGTVFQIKTAQQSEAATAAAETTKLAFVYQEIAPASQRGG